MDLGEIIAAVKRLLEQTDDAVRFAEHTRSPSTPRAMSAAVRGGPTCD